MQVKEIIHAWGAILDGRRPALSIELTRECPLRCPGCYAYEDQHLGGHISLRELQDSKGDELVKRTLELVDKLRPLHISLVGGDPLVRYRELDVLLPKLILDRGIHVQLVTSAFRILTPSWNELPRLNIVVSIDGLERDHDVRRAPATYARILKNIVGQKITVHCTITAQMMGQPGYLDEFTAFWHAREEVKRIWFSFFTPQIGADLPEILTQAQRADAIEQMMDLRARYPKLDMPERVIREFAAPPKSPEDCIFALTTETISADFTTRISPCQLGGNPDCGQCGCIASMGLAAVGNHMLGGFIPVSKIFKASEKLGRMLHPTNALPPKPAPQLRVLQ